MAARFLLQGRRDFCCVDPDSWFDLGGCTSGCQLPSVSLPSAAGGGIAWSSFPYPRKNRDISCKSKHGCKEELIETNTSLTVRRGDLRSVRGAFSLH